jgi:formylglycine-generating enzyme required for sulfatase activity
MRSLSPLTTALLLLATTAPSAEPSSHPWTVYEAWPFDATEAKHRQQETAKALGIPVKKTITIGKDPSGKPVTMDFMLIPAGTFVMGMPEPVAPAEPTDDVWIGWLVFSGGLAAVVSMLALVFYRANRDRRRLQFSLRGLLLVMIAAGVMAMGASRVIKVRENEKLYWQAMREHVAERKSYAAMLMTSQAVRGETPHRVTITRPFYLGMTETTQPAWQAVVGNNPSLSKGPNLPVELMNWHDVQKFLAKLSSETGHTFRLPSEAEWEYACRAGSRSRFGFGDNEAKLGAYAWHKANSGGSTHPVGGLRSNAWGLHDMHGNVFERTQDWHGDYPSGLQINPTGPKKGFGRVSRGGSAVSGPVRCRSAHRRGNHPNDKSSAMGFRVVLEIPLGAFE